MSKEEVFQEFAKLNADERHEFWLAACELELKGMLTQETPTDEEKAALEEAIRDDDADPDNCSPVREVIARLRTKS